MNILAANEQFRVYKVSFYQLLKMSAVFPCRNLNLAAFCIPGKVPVPVEVLSNRFRNLQGAAALNISHWCSFVLFFDQKYNFLYPGTLFYWENKSWFLGPIVI